MVKPSGRAAYHTFQYTVAYVSSDRHIYYASIVSYTVLVWGNDRNVIE